jgi:hypothetical protein
MNESLTSRPFNIEPAAIAFALARNECGEQLSLKDALVSVGLDPADTGLRSLLKSELFKQQYAGYVRELKESGESFKLKARVQAEELLRTQWEIIHDKTAPHNVRMKGIENVVEWADLKPRKMGDGTQAPASISIYIDLGDSNSQTIDVTPVEIIEAKP